MERNVAWAAAMAAGTVFGSLAAACLMPFVALAAMAASTLPRREGAATVFVAWLANQTIGFALLGYPLDAPTMGWGLAIGIAAAVAFTAYRVVGVRDTSLVRLLGSTVLAFAAYELVLFAYGVVGGGTGAFTPAVVALLARNEALWLAGLVVVREVVLRAAPGWAPTRLGRA